MCWTNEVTNWNSSGISRRTDRFKPVYGGVVQAAEFLGGCTLIVYVDDATSRLEACRFAAAETTEAYMEVTRAHFVAHGRSVAYYSDKYGVFRVNKKGKAGELTQFSRALKTLDIAALHAHSPQAKGRVVRANRTLQDRLVKEMRLRTTPDDCH